MKRVLIVSTLLLITVAISQKVYAQAYQFSVIAPSGQTLYFTKHTTNNGHYATVTYPSLSSPYWVGYTKPTGSLIIPSTIVHNGMTYIVTEIKTHAFYDCKGLTTVSVPSTVTSIGQDAFYNVRHIEYYGSAPNGYDNWGALSKNGMTDGDFIFTDTAKVHLVSYIGSGGSVTIPSTVNTIGNMAFYNCSGLSSVNIPNSVTLIGDYAFYSCSGLSSVNIPNSVTLIGDYAFYSCSGMSSVNISNSITSIGVWVFANCSNLTSVVVPNNVSIIDDGAFVGCTNLASITFPNSLITIGNASFQECSSLSLVALPESVVSIGTVAFSLCSNLNVITCESMIPPTLGVTVFHNSSNIAHIYVPCSSVSAYQTAQGWDNLSSIISRPPFDFSYSFYPSNNTRGNISNISNMDCDSNITVTASANYGYHFDSWSDGGTANPRTFHITKDTNVAAFFAKNIYQIWAVTNNNVRGIVSGSDTVEYLDTVILTATANYGYHFAHWDDNNTSNPRQVQVTQDRTYTAYFNYNQYSISLDVDTTIHGGVVGAGSYNYLSQRIITANPNYGYHFIQWSDGNTDNPRTITLTQDTAFTAFFDKNIYNVSVIANDDARGFVAGGDTVEYLDTITISATANYGYHFAHWDDNNTCNPRQLQVTQNKIYTAYFDYNQYSISLGVDTTIHGGVVGMGNYNYLSQHTITAIPNYGYHFTQWDDGNTDNPRTITLTRDTAFTAFFAKNIYQISVVANDNDRGMVLGGDTVEYLDTIMISATANYGYHFAHWDDGNIDNPRWLQVTQSKTYTAYFDYNQYTITLGVDTIIHGSVAGAGNFNYLSQHTITAIPNYGYHFIQWDDGNTDNPRIIPLTQDTSFVALFAKNIYTLTGLSADTTRGSVIGSNTREYLDTVTLTAAPNYGYHFSQWNDGDTNNPRVITLTQDTTITALFAKNTYSIALIIDTSIHGSVTGAGTYEYLDSCTFSATANYGYHFTHWSDGDTNNPRIITLIQDTSFTAFYAKNTYTLTLQSNDITIGDVLGGTICEYLDTVNISANVILPHYHFVRWSDGDTTASRSVVVIKDSVITAFFAIDTHNVTVITNGYGVATGSSVVPYGSEVIINAIPIDGYHFAKWSNGSRYNPDTITVTKDTLLTAIFVDDLVPQICMVSVQDGRNVVIWEKGIEVLAYNIYRESNVINEYELVGSVPYDSISIWIDTASRPMTHSYRYRMTATDIYGYESGFGDIHKTMHLTINQGIGNRWNLVWTEYEGADYTTYVIYRGTNATNIQQIDMMAAGGNTTYTDESAPDGDIYYQVGVLMTTPCNPTKSSTISLSNIATNGSVVGIRDIHIEDFKVFSEYGKIVVESILSRPVQLFDMMGRALYTTANGCGKITIPVPSSGIYLIKVGDYPARKVVVVK